MKYLPRIKAFFEKAIGENVGAYITGDANMETVPGWDSQSFLSLIVAMEDEFAITVSMLDAVGLYSVAAIDKYLEKRLG
jgi:acyl carrier protein